MECLRRCNITCPDYYQFNKKSVCGYEETMITVGFNAYCKHCLKQEVPKREISRPIPLEDNLDNDQLDDSMDVPLFLIK